MCMLAADTMEALGFERGQYVIKVNNRKVLDGIMESVGIDLADTSTKLAVLRSLDKLDKFDAKDVRLLLGAGRKDESGDFTKGAGLGASQIDAVMQFVATPFSETAAGPDQNATQLYKDGIAELQAMSALLLAGGYGEDRVRIDVSVVRGLEYYTGPVFEAELLIPATDDKGNPVRFGSVGGGGRYDDLVARFTGQKVPATGFSIGVSRLQAALNLIGRAPKPQPGPVVVTVMDRDRIADYQKLVQILREADIRAELYLGNPKKFGRQLEYADRRGSPLVVIQGTNEREAGEVILKDLIEGAKAAQAIKDNKEWKEARPAQVSVKMQDFLPTVREILARHT